MGDPRDRENIRALLAAIAPDLQKVEGQLARESSANLILNQPYELNLSNLTTVDDPIVTAIYDFKSVIFSDGTDKDTYVYAILGKPNAAKRPQKFWNNSAFNFGTQVPEITFFSPAQPGKKITAYLFRDAQVTTGQMILNGNVTVSPSTALVPLNNPVHPGAAAAILVNADTTTKVVSIQNNAGTSIFIGPSNVSAAGATRGIEILPNGFLQMKCSSDIYFYSAVALVAGDVTVLKET